MNAIAKQWVEFLKTNPPKTIGRLQSLTEPKKRCCLGHLAVQILKHETSTGSMKLTEGEADKAGLISLWGDTKYGKGLEYKGRRILNKSGNRINALSSLNDQENFNHAEIAEIIEENQDILFYDQ